MQRMIEALGALVIVRDTYRQLGWGGYHLQPAGAVAAALESGSRIKELRLTTLQRRPDGLWVKRTWH